MNKITLLLCLLLSIRSFAQSNQKSNDNTLAYLDSLVVISEKLVQKGKYDRTNENIQKIITLKRTKQLPYSDPETKARLKSYDTRIILLLDKMIEKEPSIVNYNSRGTFNRSIEDFKSALKDYHSALKLDPNNFIVLFNIGKIYEDNKRYKKSLEYYSKAIENGTNLGTLYLNRGFIYLQLNKYQLAIKDLEKSLLNSESPMLLSYGLNNLGFAYFKLKMYDKSLDYFEQSIDKHAENSYAFKNKALLYFELNKEDEACELLQEAYRLGYQNEFNDEVDILARKHCKTQTETHHNIK